MSDRTQVAGSSSTRLNVDDDIVRDDEEPSKKRGFFCCACFKKSSKKKKKVEMPNYGNDNTKRVARQTNNPITQVNPGQDDDDSDDAAAAAHYNIQEHIPKEPLLPPQFKKHTNKNCLVLDLDETLVHSSFKHVPGADFIIPVEIENVVHQVYVMKRPGVDEFMKRVGQLFEVVVFTASLSKYADPVLDLIDIHKVIAHRLFREACSTHRGSYVKDLSKLGRNVATSIIIDNSPHSYLFHPQNAIPVQSWISDMNDTELLELLPLLEDLSKVTDVVPYLATARMNGYRKPSS